MLVARISGVNLPTNKHVGIALTHIFGVGRTTAKKLCEQAGVDPARKLADLAESEFETIRELLKEYSIEGDLRRSVSMSIKRKLDLACYQGLRHRRGLPVNGQRTKTNARTRKGKKKPIRR
jgi:small subunit ribosomal protein S13